MRIGGRWGARPAAAAVRQGTSRVSRSPAFGVAVITPLVFAGAVAGAAPSLHPTAKAPAARTAISPVAAVAPAPRIDMTGPTVIAIARPPTSFHVAVAAISAPPPPRIVNAPGALGIPIMALSAYRNAEQKMAAAAPGCGVSWNLLAGIGRIESMHANGGATDSRGTAINPIYGPSLDGSLPGNEVIVQSNVGNTVTYARAVGPMQFLPGTWARYAADGDGDGVPDPQNLFDSTLAAANYLCSGGLNLRDPGQVMAAILRYNNSMSYAQNVLGWAAAYATGVVPVDLPPITGPPPPIGDAHLEHGEGQGLGPALPFAVNGPGARDPFAQRTPLIDFGPQSGSPQDLWPWMQQSPYGQQAPWLQQPPWMQQPQTQQPLTPQPGCTLICITSQVPNQTPGAPAAGAAPIPNGGIVIAPQAPAAPPPFPEPFAPPPLAPAAPVAPAAPAAPNGSPKPAGPAAGEPALAPVS